MRVLLANLAWFLSTLPDALRFRLALDNPAKAQARAAARRRPTRPEDVILEEPTSGTTGGTKWIPYTEQLRREFMRGVNPWMASVYLRHPGLFFRTHYWSLSPFTEVRQPEDGRRRGFAEDREYLGPVRVRLTRALFPVTAAVAEEPRISLCLLSVLSARPSLNSAPMRAKKVTCCLSPVAAAVAPGKQAPLALVAESPGILAIMAGIRLRISRVSHLVPGIIPTILLMVETVETEAPAAVAAKATAEVEPVIWEAIQNPVPILPTVRLPADPAAAVGETRPDIIT